MVLSIDPDAINVPVGSNLAAKISPECPESSINGACRSLVRGAYASRVSIEQRVLGREKTKQHTA